MTGGSCCCADKVKVMLHVFCVMIPAAVQGRRGHCHKGSPTSEHALLRRSSICAMPLARIVQRPQANSTLVRSSSYACASPPSDTDASGGDDTIRCVIRRSEGFLQYWLMNKNA